MEEPAVIQKAMLGDTLAIEALIDTYYSAIYAFCCRHTGNQSAGADLCQETFLRMVEHLPAYAERGLFKSWLFQIAVNVCRDAFRKSHADLSWDEDGEMPAENSFEERVDNAAMLKAALDKLPATQREVILLRYYHDCSLKEIARIAGVPVPTVKTRLHRGLRKLRGELGEAMLLEA